MKSSYLRAGLALLCGVILSACGGNNGNLSLSGSIVNVGQAKAGLVLINKGNGEKISPDLNATTFLFTKLLSTDEKFDVEVDTQPTGADCKPSNNTGSASVYTVYNVIITCTANPRILGGTVKNLTGKGLVVTNGPDQLALQPSATPGADISFTFPTKVSDGSQYGATVLYQPAGQTCSFDPALNPGTMTSVDQLGLIVNCVNN